MRLAHLSDLHLSADKKPENLIKVEQLLAAVADSGVHHLVITGDLTHNAGIEDLRLLRGLLIKYDLLRSDRLSLVIGNHDIFGGIFLAEEILTMPKRWSETDYHQQVNTFCHYFRESFDNTIRPLKDSYFPFAKIIGNQLLIGINSIAPYSKIRNPLTSNGRVNSGEFDAVKQLLDGSEFSDLSKIVITHHHFMPKMHYRDQPQNVLWKVFEHHIMKLRGKAKMINLLAKHGVRLVLHGHVHDNHSYSLKGVRFLNGGASVEGYQGELCINFVTLAGRHDLELQIQKFSDNRYIYDEVPVIESLVPQFAG
jgi:3',5'-cyclic AMP phosphodiesterase CpdA